MKTNMLDESPLIFNGEKFVDERGELSFVNDFNMNSIKRMYSIKHSNISIVRAWQAHRKETKSFKCISGKFLVVIIKIDDFINPSPDLNPEVFILDANQVQVLYIPGGYANGIKALEVNSELMVFSNLSLEEAKQDQYKFDKNLWYKW